MPQITADMLPPDWRDWYEERLSIMWESPEPMPSHLPAIALAETLEAMRRDGMRNLRYNGVEFTFAREG